MTAVSREVRVASQTGLHARPAAILVRAAATVPAKVTLTGPGGKAVDCRSLLSVLALGVGHGDLVVLSAEGEGAEQAVDQLVQLLQIDHDAPPA